MIYSGHTLISFFGLFFHRMWLLITGQLPFEALVSDEIQILVLSCVAISGALVGTFLVLRRMTMLANALSHTILLGIVVTFLLFHTLSTPILLIAALVTGVVTTFLTEFLSKVIKLQEDASIGLIFSIFFALGIVLVSLFSRNGHVGTELVMGSADALVHADIKGVAAILGVNLALFFFLYHAFKITTFDPQLARTMGFSPLLLNYLLMVQTSATAIGGFRVVGVVMILAFFVIPPLAARLLTHNLVKLIWLSVAIAVSSVVIGVALSRHCLTCFGVGLSTGGLVVCVLGLIYGCVALTNRLSKTILAPS